MSANHPLKVTMSDTTFVKHFNIRVTGVVQGVGFRPFIYKLARQHNLRGWVRNTSGYVEVDIEGEQAELTEFIKNISIKAPTAACVDSIDARPIKQLSNYDCFKIITSRSQDGKYQLVSPDLSTCTECVAEIFEPSSRRFAYPFTNCTNCGPRFTIIKDIPYDRPLTTMSLFAMCPDCRAEYLDPSDRRFHAQPIACPSCGPRLELMTSAVETVACPNPLTVAGLLLREGKIIAIKGLGGFQLACDATNEKSVEQLRLRKNRPSKPFAVMLCNLNNVHYYCDFGKTEELLLTSPQSPIVLLKLRDQNALAFGVAPNLKYLGVMLPYTPLHHLLIKEAGCPLIMTSGNISNEPIAADNTEACTRLNGIADYFLCHNRDIYVRYDDSVAMCVNEQPSLIRRARGYAPFPLKLPFKPSRSILGCGAEMKGTFCLLRDEHAFLSQHIGDMESIETLHHFENTLATYARMFRIEPQVIACDAHPDYLSTNLAHRIVERNPVLELHSVQHHHAHVAACMAENGVNEPVIGIAFDGTGYGSDGNIWGGEFLLADYRSSQRLAHLEYMPLPGGDAATRHPLRIALSYIYTLLGPDALLTSGLTKRFSQSELELLCRQIDRRLNSPLTSSAGRLFDAVSALLGICCEVNYEGQAAIELEMAATDIINPSKRYSLDTGVENGSKIFGLSSLFNAILKDIVAGIDKTVIAACFHASLADFIAMESRKMAHECGVRSVALCGGVFQNRLLLGYTTEALQNSGLTVLVHKQVPANDGGIALGQAAVAAYKYSE